MAMLAPPPPLPDCVELRSPRRRASGSESIPLPEVESESGDRADAGDPGHPAKCRRRRRSAAARRPASTEGERQRRSLRPARCRAAASPYFAALLRQRASSTSRARRSQHKPALFPPWAGVPEQGGHLGLSAGRPLGAVAAARPSRSLGRIEPSVRAHSGPDLRLVNQIRLPTPGRHDSAKRKLKAALNPKTYAATRFTEATQASCGSPRRARPTSATS